MQRASRKESASIPGHASRYAAERQALCGTIVRALHHVTHFRPEKMAPASSHMNTRAGNWERSKRTAEGRMKRGAQPMITVGFAASCGLATKLVLGLMATRSCNYAFNLQPNGAGGN